MAEAAEHHADLIVHALPAPSRWGTATHAQLARLKLHWRLVDGNSREAAGDGAVAECRESLAERAYRAIDTRLFDRGRWRIAATALDASQAGAGMPPLHLAWQRDASLPQGVDGFCVEYEGLPMSALDRAVRLRLGQRGGMVHARVWLLRSLQAPALLMTGRLALNHRSLHRSVVLCAAKLPTLLHAARLRLGRAELDRADEAVPPPAPLGVPRLLWRLSSASIDWLVWRGQWQLEIGRLPAVAPGPGETIQLLQPPDSGYWADPFFLRHGKRLWLLFEELAYATDRGRIGALEIDGSGRPVAPARTLLDKPWHLSYPFVWQEAGRSFVLPEAGDSGELTLYEVVGDELQLHPVATLLSGVRLVDATVVAFQGRLWMFAGSGDYGASVNDVLHVYWAERIEGPWHAHALNPVKVDASSSRPAGAMWVADGTLYRVAQDCSSTYGGSIRCMRVTRLNEHEFEEQPVPEWGRSKSGQSEPWHTFNRCEGLSVVDRLVRQSRWRARRQGAT